MDDAFGGLKSVTELACDAGGSPPRVAQGSLLLFRLSLHMLAEYACSVLRLNPIIVNSVHKYSDRLTNTTIGYARRARVSIPWPFFSCCLPYLILLSGGCCGLLNLLLGLRTLLGAYLDRTAPFDFYVFSLGL